MRSIKPMEAAKIGYVAISALLCVLGAALFFVPEFSVSLIARLTGIVMIAFGIVKLGGYFSKDLFRLAFQFDLAFGILLIMLGVIMLVYPNRTMSFFCVMTGIATLADGLFKIQIAIESKRFGIRTWWLVLMVAAITCIVGALLTFRPVEGTRVLAMLMGVSIFADGALNLSVALCTVKIIRHQRKDVIETDDYKVGKD